MRHPDLLVTGALSCLLFAPPLSYIRRTLTMHLKNRPNN